MIRFSRNAWHARLQRLIFDGDGHGRDLCQHFWRTIGALALVPVWCLFWVLAGIGATVSVLMRRLTDRYIRSISVDEAFIMHAALKEFMSLPYGPGTMETLYMRDRRFARRVDEYLTRWKMLNPDWQLLFSRPALHETWLLYRARRLDEFNDKSVKTPGVRSHGLFVSFFASLKNRACPMIEWYDN